MAYPSSIDSFTAPSGTSLVTSPDHANLHAVAGSAITLIENKVGIGSGSAAANQALIGSGAGTSGWTGTWNNAILGTPTIGTPSIVGGTVTASLLGTNQMTGGTLASAAIGTPTLLGGTIAVSGTVIPVSIGAALAPTVVTLADSAGGTITPNAQAAQVFHLILGTTAGNRTFASPANATGGQSIVLRVKQNTNNTGTIVWASAYRVNSSGTVILGTTSSYNYYSFRYNEIDSKWDSQGVSTGIV